MATWSYVCRPCRGETDDTTWYVDAVEVEESMADVNIVRVKVGPAWRCAILDRSQRVEVERMLIRRVNGTDAADCSECEDS